MIITSTLDISIKLLVALKPDLIASAIFLLLILFIYDFPLLSLLTFSLSISKPIVIQYQLYQL